MLPVDSPYIRRHFAEAARAVALTEQDSICEWGAGMGRFSRLFAQQQCALTAIELSPELAAICRDNLRPWPAATVSIGDILEVAERLPTSYSLIAGFFVLHHLPTVEPYFRAAQKLLLPGGRFVFVEPNPLNPLYAIQITCTPGMSWSEEAGTYRMWPTAIRRAAETAGFCDFKTYRYGALPRAIYNAAAQIGVERWPEYLIPSALGAFQVFTARLSQNGLNAAG